MLVRANPEVNAVTSQAGGKLHTDTPSTDFAVVGIDDNLASCHATLDQALIDKVTPAFAYTAADLSLMPATKILLPVAPHGVTRSPS